MAHGLRTWCVCGGGAGEEASGPSLWGGFHNGLAACLSFFILFYFRTAAVAARDWQLGHVDARRLVLSGIFLSNSGGPRIRQARLVASEGLWWLANRVAFSNPPPPPPGRAAMNPLLFRVERNCILFGFYSDSIQGVLDVRPQGSPKCMLLRETGVN